MRKGQKVVDKTQHHDILLLTGEDRIAGKYGINSKRYDNGEKYVAYCEQINFVITTMFLHIYIYLYLWTSPSTVHKNQLEHAVVNGKFRQSLTDTRVIR